jgi:uncharacterized membrane protein YhhN
MPTATLLVLGTCVAVASLLAAERRGARSAAAVAKTLASTGFVALGLERGALASPYGRAVAVALALSWLGDVLLIPKGARGAFLAGLVSFLLAHVAYGVAFLGRGRELNVTAVAFLVCAAGLAAALRWLHPHVHGVMRGAVLAYVLVISAMVVLAAGAASATSDPVILVGAVAFYVSDLAVARERFVVHSFGNKLWGLPLYYGAQLVLAASVARAL